MNTDFEQLNARIANLEQSQAMIMPLITVEVQKAVKETVNGKIDTMHKEMSEKFQRLEPMMIRFDNWKGWRATMAILFGPLLQTLTFGGAIAVIYEALKGH